MTSRAQVWLGGVVLVYLAGLLLCVGCSQQDNDTSTKSPAGSSPLVAAVAKAAETPEPPADDSAARSERRRLLAEQRARAEIKPLLKDWPQPAIAIVLSGEQNGYFEPCGCTEIQSGGFSRRDNLFQQLQARGWKTVALDLGGLSRRTRRQSQIKFETMQAALKDMGYSVMGVGPSEIRFGPDFLLSQHILDPDLKPENVAFTSANVVLYGSRDIGTPVAFQVVEQGGIKLGVTSVLGTDEAQKLKDEGRTENIEIVDPTEALKAVLPQLEAAEPDLLVLLSYAKMDETRALLAAFPQFDVALTAGGAEDPDGEPEQVGDTVMLDVGHKGKYTGVLGYYPDAQPRFRFELVKLDKFRFEDSKRMIEHMRYYQQRLRDERLAVTELPIRYPGNPDARFVGSLACQSCHERAYDKWKDSRHSHAYESLKHARAGQTDYGISRVHDPECLACHVGGWEPQEVLRFEGGFQTPEFVEAGEKRELMRQLEGQQCESCHGPASEHIRLVEEGEMEKALAQVRVTKKQAQDRVCYGCHDVDNSPNFDFEEYWLDVAHPWRD